MPDFTQEDQPIRVDTVLAEDVLLLAGFQGSEKLSEPYAFDLELLSEDPNLNPDDLLRTPISVTLRLPDGEDRQIHGRVRSFGYEGRRGELSFYRAEMVPWLWFLSLSHNCRIFQHLSVPDIVEEVFGDYEGVEFRTQFAQDYAEREYCVQYRESDLNFVSRLLEEEGIFYFFEHGEDGHTLVLTDYSQMQPCEGQAEARMYSEAVTQQDVVKALTHRQAVHSGVVSLADYDEMKPSLDLTSSMAGDEPEEIYEYQKNLFRELDDGERYARIALEREEATRHVVRGHGTCRSFQTGHRFTLTNHDRREANRDYALVEVRHRARTGTYVAGGSAGELDYENHFVAVPHGTTYRPPLRARKPTMPGSQTAKVVGPGGERINVDDQGRVKVQFHWDRQGSEDENSSCWVRVSQNWAGKNWGGMFIPHIDQEVIVDFLEGDPDRPIITGRVYNAEQMPPQDLPANKHKSIIEDDFGNELVFDATPGKEHIRLRSPHHESMLELGKSRRLYTDSDFIENIQGKKAWTTKGLSLSGHIGAKVDFEFGGSVKGFFGHKGEISYADSLKVSLDREVKWSYDKEYVVNGKSFAQHVGDQAQIISDKEVLIAGGGGDGGGASSAGFEANGDGLVLQYGDDSGNRESLSAKKAKMKKTALYIGSGLGASVIGAGLMSWHASGADQDVQSDIWTTLLFELFAAVPSAVEALKEGGSDEQDPTTLASLHSDFYSKVHLHQGGISLRNKDDQARIDVDQKNIELHASDKLLAKAAGDVLVKGDWIELDAPKGIDVSSSGAVVIKSNQIVKIQ